MNNFDLILNSHNDIDSDRIINNSTKQEKMNLRANIFLPFLVGALSLSSANTLSNYEFNKVNSELMNFSLEKGEQLSNEVSEYRSQLSKNYIRNKKSFIEIILSFKSLENSWDGYGALPLGIKCATNAINLLDRLCATNEILILSKISDVYPNPNGTVTFEWENKISEIISLEVGKDTFTYFVDFNSSETKFYNKQDFTFENIQLLKKYISAV